MPGRNKTQVGWFVALAVAVAAAPWVVGRLFCPAGWEFFAAWPKAPGDVAVYYSYIEQGRTGGPMMSDKFTSEPQSKNIWQPLWLVAGKTAKFFSVDAPTAFFAWRLISTAVCALVIWSAAGFFSETKKQQWLIAIMGYFGAGFGGLWSAVFRPADFSKLPVDTWVSEAFPWLSSWASPHFMLVTAGLVYLLIIAEKCGRSKAAKIFAGPIALAVISVHPFHILTLLLVYGAMTAVDVINKRADARKDAKRRALTLAWTAPALLYYGLALFDGVTWGRAIQNINSLPAPALMIVGLGPLFVLAILGYNKNALKQNRELWYWVAAVIVLAVIPWSFQRRMLQGLVVPLGFLASFGVVRLWRLKKWGKAVVGLTLAGMTMTLVNVFTDVVQNYFQDSRAGITTLSYLSPEYRQMLENTRKDGGLVLAGRMNGNIVGALSGQNVYFGHDVETVRAAEKTAEVSRFYGDMSSEERKKFLQDEHICWVLVTPYEETYGWRDTLAVPADLMAVWREKDVTLFSTGLCD